MKGIQFVTDDRGERTGVLIDLKRHGDLWEDLYDGLIELDRRHEPRESLEEVKQRLRRQGKLSGNA